jgi:DNA polymerase-3 subunit gamma/tau
MSNFVVSARKYRPARFDEVVGQEHVSKTLKNALQNDHLAHVKRLVPVFWQRYSTVRI